MNYRPISNKQDLDAKIQIISHRNPIYPSLKYPEPQPIHTLESEITSSLLFQQLIYYNWFYSIIFFYLYTASQIQRILYFNIEYGVPIRIIIEAIFAILEIFRLQNGFYGNLKQSFPEICAFLMLSILTIACQIALIQGFLPTSPLEWTLLFYGLLFQFLQILVCILTMSRLTRTQKALFLWRNPITNK